MLVRCCVCKDFLREKEPLNDLSITDTYCKICLEKQMKNIETWKQKNLLRKEIKNI